MDARRAALEQRGALSGRVVDADVHHDLRVVAHAGEPLAQVLRDARAAHRREALELVDVRDRHDPRDDGDRDARFAGSGYELEVAARVEEELRDQEARAGVDLGLQVLQAAVEVAALDVTFRVAGAADGEAAVAADEGGELAREAEAAGGRDEAVRPLRRIA